MRHMKKNFIKLLGLLLIVASPVFAVTPSGNETYQIYVHNIETEKTDYKVGEKIDGTFTLSNLSETPQSDIYYSISSGVYHPENLTIEGVYGVTDKIGPLYIKGNSKDSISFSYTLPKSVSGNVGIQIVATLKDGTLVGRSDLNVMVEGMAKPSGYVINPRLSISGYPLMIRAETGPTIYDKETLSFNFSISSTTKKYTVNPILKIYDRVDNVDALKRTINLDPIVTDNRSSDSKDFKPIIYSVSLPTDLDPLVYYGVITFESEGIDISPVSLRYIIAGPIATVRNITTNTLEVKVGETINTIVTYGGQPIDEFRLDKQLRATSTILTVTAINEKNEIVATVSQPLDLDTARSVIVPLKANMDAKSLSFISTIKTIDGIILDEYTTRLPSPEDVKNQTPYKEGIQSSKKIVIVIVIIVIILLLTILFIIFNKKPKASSIPLSLFGLIFIVGLLIFGMSNAKVLAEEISQDAQDYLNVINDLTHDLINTYLLQWKIVSSHNLDPDPNTRWFNVTTVSSPLPPQLLIYEPGQQFRLTFSATYADCNNDGRQYQAYVYDPSIAWQNQTPKLDGTFADRGAYWSNKGIKLLDWNGGDPWDELLIKSNLQVITAYSGLNSGAGISLAREVALKKLTRTNVTVDIFCEGVEKIYRYCQRSTGELKMLLYTFHMNENVDAKDYVNWAKDHTSRLNTVKSILAEAGTLSPALAKFDFSATSNLKIQGYWSDYVGGIVTEGCSDPSSIRCQYNADNDYTRTYIAHMKTLKNETYSYAKPTLGALQAWYSLSDHARELFPTTLTKTYTAPKTPGIHRMYFYLFQNGNSGQRDITVRQFICVRGAGVCPNEIDVSRPVVNITSIDGISATSSNVHWTYKDKENHTQKDYTIELTTVQGNFTDLTKMKIFSIASESVNATNIRNHVMTGLRPATKYYARMRSKENSPQAYWSLWTNGNYSFTTSNGGVGTCSCSGRSYVCKDTNNVTTSSTAGSSYCALDSSCIASSDTTNTTFTISAVRAIDKIIYTRNDNGVSVQKERSESYIYTIPKVSGIQTSTVDLKDTYDNQTSNTTCSIDNGAVPPVGQICACQSDTSNWVCKDSAGVVQSSVSDPTACPVAPPTTPPTTTLTPRIILTKTPSVVLNKGGSCTINWALLDIPTDSSCTLSGFGVTPTSPTTISGNSFQKIDNLRTNQKYVVTCSGPSMTTITKSVICRVNPDVFEN